MPFKGRQMEIYGAYAKEKEAERKHKRVPRSFIRTLKIKGHTRYLVLRKRRK